ncbi:MAG: nitronate monooxygenase [Gemmatimonadales bacterium]|nr:nitronate monooxygenase [Gemmatimonadales bacterium]
MGVGISDWRLARAVSLRGQLGVVSGTALDTVMVRRLQDGDAGGHMRRVMTAFPLPRIAEDVLRLYFRPDGRPPGTPYKMLPVYKQTMSLARQLVTVLAAFVEVYLAKEGHQGMVGMNLLTKVQIPTLPSLYGAMLAGTDVILMGAGIPREIPAALDHLARHEAASLRFEVEGLPSGREEHLTFDPKGFWSATPPELHRPLFLAIIASNSLATMLARKASGRVDGFVIEGPTAGGHNAPPRGEPRFNERGEPVYGERDVVDLAKMAELGLPFWLAGGTGRQGRLQEALAAGASGIQVGTLFAYCDESGLARDLKRSVLEHAARGEVTVLTDPRASPTGYPFKVVSWPGAPGGDVERERLCDLGGLRVAYWTPEGKIGYRCAGEPVDAYVRKGGKIEDTVGRRCLCNALTADLGLGQLRTNGQVEPPLLTSGDDLERIGEFLAGRAHYSAGDVLDCLTAITATSS